MPNIKLHDYSSNAIVELDSDAIVYRTAVIPHTHLALVYNYALNVKETPEQIDILAKGGKLDDWIEYKGRGCPVPPTRKVLVRTYGVMRVDGTHKNAGISFSRDTPKPVEAGTIKWFYNEIDYYDVDWEQERTARVGTTHYKIIGY